MKSLILAVAVVAAGLAQTALAAGDGRPTVGVAEFTNQSGAAWWRGGVGWELSGMLSNELSSSGDFHVVERQKLQNVMEEQNLGASGRVAPGTGAKIGKITGAQYLITGTVTSYEENP
jgi:curli biogenesis system outer membrane secretion channel CsgG